MPESRRVHERVECDLPVVLLHDGKEITGRTINVSLGGLFITASQPLPYGTQAKVRLTLPALKEETEIPVTIRWTTKEGMGVQFGSLRAREVWALNQLMK
jgi:type IV pilus assembly protein PilZ